MDKTNSRQNIWCFCPTLKPDRSCQELLHLNNECGGIFFFLLPLINSLENAKPVIMQGMFN